MKEIVFCFILCCSGFSIDAHNMEKFKSYPHENADATLQKLIKDAQISRIIK